MTRFFVLLSLASTSQAGTLVGHPVSSGFAAGNGLVYTGGALPITTIVVDHCDSSETVEVYETIDPVAHDPIGLPEGDLCGLSIGIDSSGLVELWGHVQGGSNTFALELDGVTSVVIEVDPSIYVPEEEEPGGPTGLRLASPNWITAGSLGLGSGSVVVDSSHGLHDQLVDAVSEDSVIW